jgi:hypothetical protein
MRWELEITVCGHYVIISTEEIHFFLEYIFQLVAHTSKTRCMNELEIPYPQI